ncbi:MAG: alpha/beta fold hydrolase [Nocardioides sp.]
MAAGTSEGAPRTGTFANSMEFVTWGNGPRTMLFLPGGPGSAVPSGLTLRMTGRWFSAYVDAGYTAWRVTRRRHMPPGHSIADIADDYARVIDEGLGGHADLVVGESYGGMVAQYLAARHPDRVGHVAIVASGWRLSDWCKQVDTRLAEAVSRGDMTAAGAAFAEYVMPGDRLRWVRRLVAPIPARWLKPPGDILVEVNSELAFDSRGVLPSIQAPVLLLGGDRDRIFPPDVVEETAALIPDCSLVRYPGKGHVGTASSRRVPADVLAFVSRD